MKVMLEAWALPPERAHDTDAGLDIKSPDRVVVPAHGSVSIFTGVHVELPPGTAGLLVSKSGLNVRHDILSTGLIDEGYDGGIVVKLYNHGDQDYVVEREHKISQLVVIPVRYEPVEIVDRLDGKSERGSNGFGSSGK